MRNFKLNESLLNRKDDSIKSYLRELSKDKYKPLTRSDEEYLFNRLTYNKCQKSFEKILNSNLRFVVSVAKSYQGNGVPISDMINEGNLGLIKSIYKFDLKRGNKFITYSAWWIRQGITECISQLGKSIRLPNNKIHELKAIRECKKELEQDLKRKPSTTEIARELNMNVEDVTHILMYTNEIKSFDMPIDFEENTTLGDTIEDEDNPNREITMIKSGIKYELKRLLEKFSKRDREIVKLSFGIDCDFALDDDAIADRYSLHRERVRQIRKHVIEELKKERELKTYL